MPRRLQKSFRSFLSLSPRSQKPNSSFDYQLFLIFFFGMMPQMLLPINGITRCILTAVWVGILVRFAIQHRQKHYWQWQGITLSTLSKGIMVLIFWAGCIVPLIASTANGFLLDKDWAPSHPLAAFSEVAHLFPELMISRSPITTFCLIPCGWLIFSVMVELKIAYVSEEDFLKDCPKQDVARFRHRTATDSLVDEQSQKSFIGSIVSLFKARPFTLRREAESVSINFYLISIQDLQANPGLVAMGITFLFFSLFGTVQIFLLGLYDYFQSGESSEYALAILGAWVTQALIFLILSYVLWKTYIRTFFVRKIIEFKAYELIVGESLFGRYRKLFSIGKSALLPLEQRQKQTTVPRVSNAALIMQRRGKDVELAGHLLPEAMAAVQDVYDRYRTSNFSRFYSETKPLYLR